MSLHSGARVLSAETVAVRKYSDGQQGNSETTFTFNRGGDWRSYFLIVLRVYLDGVYQEPPAEVLPPLPTFKQREEEDCCTLI